MDEAFIKKVQPNSPEAEQSVIGAMIMDRDAIADVIDIVNADDFYQKQNGILFEAMTELYREGKPVDLVTLQNKLKKKDVPESMKSLEFIRDLLEVVPTSANAKQYATIVREKATLRKLIKVTEDITTECYLGKPPKSCALSLRSLAPRLSSSGRFSPCGQISCPPPIATR